MICHIKYVRDVSRFFLLRIFRSAIFRMGAPYVLDRHFDFSRDMPRTSPALSVQISDSSRDEIKMGTETSRCVMLYTIETSCEEYPTTIAVRRRFHDFYTIRKQLLRECKQCHTCKEFSTKLKALPFPKRVPMLFQHQIQQRKVDLTYFLRGLVELASTTGIKCRMNGTYLCNTIGMFLGMKSMLRFALSQTDCDALKEHRRLSMIQKVPSFRRFSSAKDELPERPSLRHRSISTPVLRNSKGIFLQL